MAFSRVCMACGVDTAPAVPRGEPHYGLVVIDCPGCARVWPAARARQDALWRLWRVVARRAWWVAMLGVQGVVLAGGAWVVSFLGVSLVDQMTDAGLNPAQLVGLSPVGERIAGFSLGERVQEWQDTSGSIVVTAWLFACGAAGAWMGLTLGHLLWRRRGLVFALAVAMGATIPMFIAGLNHLATVAGHPTAKGLMPTLEAVTGVVLMAVLSGAVSIIGAPVGVTGRDVVNVLWRIVRARRRRRARARRRL